MRRILFVLIGLLALFTILRANAQEAADGPTRYIVQPGILEFQGAEGGARVAFGFLERSEEQGRTRSWNLFPVRVNLRAGKQSFVIALNGLSFLSPRGLVIGRPVEIAGIKRGDVISVGGHVSVRGTVEGDVWALGADIELLPQSVVTGNVVALGGSIEADRRAQIKGNKQSLPNLKIPFINFLASEQSAATFRFIIELLGVILFLLVLFLFIHFGRQHLAGLTGVMGTYWRGAVLYLVLAALVLPLVVGLLAASIVGIVVIPLVAVVVVLVGYFGFVAVAVRLGMWMRRQQDDGGSAYTSGLLGLLVLKGPVVLGILFSLLSNPLFEAVGRFLAAVGTIEVVVAVLYGIGGTLQYLRVQARSAAG
ncbi:MAG: hypothetical protein JW820_06200 [Spirochaetales bacterium]|nr:hypothetical protein [Spirochaetales bacterium]